MRYLACYVRLKNPCVCMYALADSAIVDHSTIGQSGGEVSGISIGVSDQLTN